MRTGTWTNPPSEPESDLSRVAFRFITHKSVRVESKGIGVYIRVMK